MSPLLFIIIMIPLTFILRTEGLGYKLGPDEELINDLLFMDNLRLYGHSEDHLQNLWTLVRLYSQDIIMNFGLGKCPGLMLKRTVRVRCEGVCLPDGEMMKEVDKNGYRYLRVLEGADIQNREMKKKIRTEYLRRFKALSRPR